MYTKRCKTTSEKLKLITKKRETAAKKCKNECVEILITTQRRRQARRDVKLEQNDHTEIERTATNSWKWPQKKCKTTSSRCYWEKKRHKTGAKDAKWQHRNAKTATKSYVKQSDTLKKNKEKLDDDKETQHSFTETQKCHGEIQHNHKVRLVSPPALSSNVGGYEARRDVHTLTSDHLWFTLSPHSIYISRY